MTMDARLVASRMPGLAMYGAPYTTQPFPGYLPYASPTDPTAVALYGPMAGAENAEAWRNGLSQAAAAGYFEPQLAAHYGYGYGPMGLADGARRKNATRETTSTLKAWLNEHRKNPYPTKGEKIMLAIITKMTLTQVSTWFANARRRLKKENKMTWSPRNRCGEDDDDDMMDDDDDNNVNSNNQSGSSENRRHGETSGNSRTSSPTPSASERIHFDTGSSQHPFVNHATIGGRRCEEGERKTSGEDEEIDLESLDEDKKEMLAKTGENFGQHENPLTVNSSQHSATPSKYLGHSLPVQGKLPFTHHHRHSMLPGARGMPLPSHLMGGHPMGMSVMGAMSKTHMKHSPNGLQNDATSKTSVAISPTSPTASTPPKPKIWSLADVATSSDAPKHRGGSPSSTCTSNTSPLPPTNVRQMIPNPAFQQEAIRSWMDGVMQQQKQMAMAAAAMAGASHPHGFLPQGPAGMMSQNFPLNPAAIAALSRGEPRDSKRFHPYGFADFAAAQQRATLAAAQAAGLSFAQPKIERCSPFTTTTVTSAAETVRTQPISPRVSAISPISSSAQQNDVTKFSTNRPDSNDSGIASAEAAKDNKHSPK